jgi:hypothetical protein
MPIANRAHESRSQVATSIAHPARGHGSEPHEQQHRAHEQTANRRPQSDGFGEKEPESAGEQPPRGPIAARDQEQRPERRPGDRHRRSCELDRGPSFNPFESAQTVPHGPRQEAGGQARACPDQIDDPSRVIATLEPRDGAAEDRP